MKPWYLLAFECEQSKLIIKQKTKNKDIVCTKEKQIFDNNSKDKNDNNNNKKRHIIK